MKCGYVALIGQPNVGKSTLLNHLLGQKLSITSRKPQTTRHLLQGIKTVEQGQMIFVDTPGLHTDGKKAMNRYLNKAAASALAGVDVVVWLIEALVFGDEEENILGLLQNAGVPVVLAVNKVDQLQDKAALLPFLQQVSQRYAFADIVPLSALKGDNLEALENSLLALLPEREALYPEDQITDRPERFFVAEIIREKLIRSLGQELPHAITVEIEKYKVEGRMVRIAALIWVERDGQKAIVIGKDGSMLKKVGERSRHDIEAFLEQKVFLQLWVKVRKGWADDERALHSLGYQL
jgi:GTP-binding protein Era